MKLSVILIVFSGIATVCVSANENVTFCNATCSSASHVCACTSNGMVTCDKRNLSSIPLLPECSTMIVLQDNNISSVDAQDFAKTSAVNFIDLANNKISRLTDGIFDNLTELEVLVLHRNFIVTISGKVFHKMGKLTSLDLSMNKITTIAQDAFNGNPLLSQLSLHKNSMTGLDERWFHNKSGLKRVQLFDNPWNCSCGLWNTLQNILDITRLQIQCNDTIGGMTSSMCITCQHPHQFKNISLHALLPSNFSNCVRLFETTQAIITGTSVTEQSTGTETGTGTPSVTAIDSSKIFKWWIYFVIAGALFVLIGTLGIFMACGTKREEKLKRESMHRKQAWQIRKA